MVTILKQKAMEQFILLVSMNMTSDKVEKKTKSVKSLVHDPTALLTYFH